MNQSGFMAAHLEGILLGLQLVRHSARRLIVRLFQRQHLLVHHQVAEAMVVLVVVVRAAAREVAPAAEVVAEAAGAGDQLFHVS
jgi:uncharacterized membrane protein YcjF (UPF0283 family)